MPASREVNWVVGTEQTFVHLYFAPEQLAPLALRLLDREPRELCLPELNFADDPELALRMARFVALDWTDTADRIAANQLGHAVLVDVLARHAGRAPHEWIVARRIERAAQLLRHRRALPLEEIARATGHASASHLVRRFKTAWGVTPGQYRAAA